MPYNNAARNYDGYADYDEEYEQSTNTRRATQPLPDFRVMGQGSQITRSRQTSALPQPFPTPGANPRRQPTNANVPNAPRGYAPAPGYGRQVVRPNAPAPQTRRAPQAAPRSRPNLQINGSTARLAVMGVALVAVLIVSYLLVSFTVHTWQVWQDDMTYGRPRITRLEAAVGHNEVGGNKTLFIAQNLKGQISITEFPGGDPAKTRVIVGPHLFGKDTDLVPIKLQTKDVNGDGQADLIVTADDQQLIYINDNGSFRQINDQERAKLKALEKEETK